MWKNMVKDPLLPHLLFVFLHTQKCCLHIHVIHRPIYWYSIHKFYIFVKCFWKQFIFFLHFCTTGLHLKNNIPFFQHEFYFFVSLAYSLFVTNLVLIFIQHFSYLKWVCVALCSRLCCILSLYIIFIRLRAHHFIMYSVLCTNVCFYLKFCFIFICIKRKKKSNPFFIAISSFISFFSFLLCPNMFLLFIHSFIQSLSLFTDSISFVRLIWI